MSDDFRPLVDQIDRMRKAGHYFDSVNLSTLLAWHGEQMAMQREIEALRRANDDLTRRLHMDTGA